MRPVEVVGLVDLDGRSPEEIVTVLGTAAAGRVGVSPVVPRLADIGYAAALARTAARTLTEPGVAPLDERLPEALLVDNPRLAERVRTVALRELLSLPEPERETLLGTLRALIDTGGSPTHAASRLYCHRNTVIYRLQRIERLTGRGLAEPRDRLLLTLALLTS